MNFGGARGQATLLLLLGGGLGLFSVLQPPAPETRTDTHLDPRSAALGGNKALAAAFAELGLGGRLWRRSWSSWAGSEPDDVLAVIAPTVPMEAAEAEALLDWVRGGGDLLWAPSTGGIADRELRDRLGVRLAGAREFDDGDAEVSSAARTVLPPPSGGPGRVFADAPADWPHWSRTYRTEGLDSPVGSVGGAPPRPTEAWVEDGRGRPGAGRWSLGEGSITLWADAEALRNDRLAVDPQGTVLVRLAAALAEGREVWIDGFGHRAASEGDLERAVWHFVRHTPAGHATALALGVLLLALVCAAVRLGAPIPPPPPPGRSTLEHGAALADAYRRARARVRPTQLLLAGAEQRLGTVSLEDWLATLRRTRPDLLREVELVELARTRPRGIEIDRLLPLSAALDTLLHAALENSDAAR